MIYFQVYKIQNSELDNEERAIYLAGTGLYEIIKNEWLIMATVSTFDLAVIEETFNNCVQAAVTNYKAFCSNVQLYPSVLEIELLTNFVKVFELVIDIKKTEAENSAAATVEAVVATVAVGNKNRVLKNQLQPLLETSSSRRNQKNLEIEQIHVQKCSDVNFP